MKQISFLLLMVAFCLGLGSCHDDDRGTEQAAALLDEARTELNDGHFERAYNLLDSMRTTYPKAVDVRRAALLFEDTIHWEEAKVELAAIDSIYAFACLDREELRSTGIDTLSAQFKQLRDRADSLRYAVDRAYQKVRFFERKISEAQKP